MVSAIGVANIVRGDWLKPGAVVLDVGINPVEVTTVSIQLTHGYVKCGRRETLANMITYKLYTSQRKTSHNNLARE